MDCMDRIRNLRSMLNLRKVCFMPFSDPAGTEHYTQSIGIQNRSISVDTRAFSRSSGILRRRESLGSSDIIMTD